MLQLIDDDLSVSDPTSTTGPEKPVIEIQGLEKRFGSLKVLKGIDAQIRAGQVTALIGPNGAGKTTLIKALLGLTRPDAGRISLFGEPLDGGVAYREKIGYMPQYAAFPENLSGNDVLALLKDLREHTGKFDEELRIAFALEDELDKPIRTLSGGTRQKVSALCAFLFSPPILILDEPTSGLDPTASSRLKDKVRRARDAGRAIILTSHIMSELEEMTDHLLFLMEGRVWFDGTIEEIRARTGEDRLERAIATLIQKEAA